MRTNKIGSRPCIDTVRNDHKKEKNMLKRETEKSYTCKIGDTAYTIESVTAPGSKLDMIDALIALMKRDIESLEKE